MPFDNYYLYIAYTRLHLPAKVTDLVFRIGWLISDIRIVRLGNG